MQGSWRCQQHLPDRSSASEEFISSASITNDFGVEGVAKHCTFLDCRREAESFQSRFLEAYLEANNRPDGRLKVAIVGADATGVELSAELYNAARELSAYGVSKPDQERLEVVLVEAGPSILPALPKRISRAARSELRKLGVEIREPPSFIRVPNAGIKPSGCRSPSTSISSRRLIAANLFPI